MTLNEGHSPGRLQLALLIACAAGLAVDMLSGAAGVLAAIVLVKLGISTVKIPSPDLVLISMSRWEFRGRLLLAGAAFLIGLVLSLAWLKPPPKDKAPGGMASHQAPFPNRWELGFLIACAAGVVADLVAVVANEFVGITMRAEMERPRVIPHYKLALVGIGSWLFEYRMVLVPAVFVLAVVVALIRLKPSWTC